MDHPLHPKLKEADITIAGQKLTFQESATLRVAMNSFLLSLNEEGLGNDDYGIKLTNHYIRHTKIILNYIHQQAK